MRRQATEWEQLAALVHELRDRLIDAGDVLHAEVWQGQAGDAWRDRADRCAAELASFADQLWSRSATMATYAGTVEDIADEALVWRLRLADPDLRTQARSMLDELGDERRVADRRIERDLDPVRVADWETTAEALHDLGVRSPTQLDPAAIGHDLAAMARTWSWQQPPPAAEAAELTALLTIWGGDGQAMGTLFAELGGQGTLDLLAAVCRTEGLHEAESLAMASVVRSALAVGSQSWDQATAEELASGLVDPLVDADRTDPDRMRDLWSVTFVLSDAQVAPLGPALSVALADRFDLIERTRPTDAIWLHPTHPAVTGVLETGLLVGFVHGPGDPSDPYAGLRHDVAGLALEHLGAHPEAALDWLTSTRPDIDDRGTLGVGRIDYWFGQRDWTISGDDFTGPMTLWRGAMNAPGGPADPETRDPDVWLRVATAMDAITTAVLSNPAFLPENTSDLADVQLGAVLSAQLVCLLEVPLHDSPAGAGGPQQTMLPGSADPMWVAGTSRDDLAVLFGIATSSPAGLDLMTRTIATLQDALLGAATVPDGYTPDEALHLVMRLQVMLDAAQAGAAAGAQERASAAASAAVETALFALSFVRIPGVDEAVSQLARRASAFLPEALTTAAANQVVSSLPSVFAGRTGPWSSAARQDSTSDISDSASHATALEASIAALADKLNVPEIDNPSNGGSASQYAASVMSDYDDLYEAFAGYAEQHHDEQD
ncbi:MAG TPA: hypothetical protein VGC67_11500 [Cellulomonas sp.]